MRILGMLTVALLACAPPCAAQDIVIEDFDARIDVRPDGILSITETIRAQFIGEWNGIIRSIAYRYDNPGEESLYVPLVVRSVQDDRKTPLAHWFSHEGGELVMKIRVPDARDATRTVVIAYEVGDVIRSYHDPDLGQRDDVYWNVTGNGWPFTIMRSHARVRFPPGVKPEDVRHASYTGPYGATGSDATARWVAGELTFDDLHPLRPGEGLTIRAEFPSGHLKRRAAPGGAKAVVKGRLKVWHPIELRFSGPAATEADAAPNPFADYRLQVRLRGPSGQVYDVPGFFDGDGNGNGVGNVWKVRFCADEAGEWGYRASFRTGEEVAVALDADAGAPTAFDGETGSFQVGPLDPAAPGFLKWGRAEYVGKHYLKFRSGPYWIKGGADSPENLLAYTEFDNQKTGTPFGEHDWAAHVRDWQPGDPTWSGGKGKGIIGMLNYLSSAHVNSIYFLPMNMGGDGQDVVPFVGYERTEFDKTHYDISKLHQWNTVFNHAQDKGIALQIVLAETEEGNRKWLDDGELGDERKLYFRELVARFGYLLAIKWNLCEENVWSADMVRDFAAYLNAVDPYEHPICVHTTVDNIAMYEPLYGNPDFSASSIQCFTRSIKDQVETVRRKSAAAGRPWVVDFDESVGGDRFDGDVDRFRKGMIYKVYFSGGCQEWIFATLLETRDLRANNADRLWQHLWYARKFMEENLPFWEMEPSDDLVTGEADDFGGAQVFAKPGEVYAVYFPNAKRTGILRVGTQDDNTFTQRWYNPRTGEFEGDPIMKGIEQELEFGPPPSDPSQDWVALVTSGWGF